MRLSDSSTLRTAISLAVGLALGGCTIGMEESAVQFTVELQDGGVWAATGTSVDSDAMCLEGGRRWLRVENAEGRELAVYEIKEIYRLASANKLKPDIIQVHEWICSDGRGSFTMREDVGNDRWAIVSGRGAFSETIGDGETSFVRTLENIPLNLYFEGTLQHPSH